MAQLLHEFTFTLSGGGLDEPRELTPTNDRLTLEWQRSSGEYSKARRKVITTKLRFTKSDYVFFSEQFAANNYTEFDLSIKKRIGGISETPTDWHECKLLLSRDAFDHARGVVEFQTAYDDIFECFLQKSDKTVNLLSFGTGRSVLSIITGTLETKTRFFNDPLPGHPTDAEIDASITGGGANAQKWAITRYMYHKVGPIYRVTITFTRERLPVGVTPPDNSWSYINDPVDGFIWVRKPQVSGPTYTQILGDQFQKDWRVLDFADSGAIDNGRLFKEAFPLIIQDTGCDFDMVKSTFFDINPDDGGADLPYDRAETRLKYLMFFQRSDILRAYADANATRLEMTIMDFLETVCKIFNCFWTIYQVSGDTIFRIEHVSFFTKPNGMDLTGSDYARQYNRFEFDSKDAIPALERFTMTKWRANTYFSPSEIQYSGEVAGRDIKEYPIPQCTTDFSALFLNDDDDENDLLGIFFMSTYLYEDEYYINQEYSEFNGALCWFELLKYYWRHDRFISGGVIKSGATTETVVMYDAKRFKELPEISVPVASGYEIGHNPDELVNTLLGYCEQQNVTYDTLTSVMRFKLLLE